MHLLELHDMAMRHLRGFTRQPPVRQKLVVADPVLLEHVLQELIEQLGLSHCPDNAIGTTTNPSAAAIPTFAPTDIEIWKLSPCTGIAAVNRTTADSHSISAGQDALQFDHFARRERVEARCLLNRLHIFKN